MRLIRYRKIRRWRIFPAPPPRGTWRWRCWNEHQRWAYKYLDSAIIIEGDAPEDMQAYLERLCDRLNRIEWEDYQRMWLW